MTSKWDFYQCAVNGKPASIYLDLALRPDATRPLLLIVWLDLRLPDPEHRMATDAEFDVLAAFEDRLCATFTGAYNGTYAGRITTDGRREFYFYSASANQIEALALSALAPFPGYTVKAWSQTDPQWQQYRDVLTPAPAALRWMRDKALIETLARRGDTPAMARPISHQSSFASKDGRSAFIASVAKAGFAVGKLSELTGARRFGVRYQLAQTPTLAVMSETTTLLARLSEKHAGQYDGWRCKAAGPRARPWWKFWS